MSAGMALRASATVSALNLVGKFLGLVKTLVIAWTFGASGLMDAFLVAYLLPTVIPNVLKGIVSAAFIPRYMDALRDARGAGQWRGVNTLFTLMLVAVSFAATLMALNPLLVVDAVAPGLGAESRELAGGLLRVMALATVVLGINAVLSAVAFAQSKFVVASLEGIVSNLFIIAACFLFVPAHGIWALAYAVIAGFAAQSLLLVMAHWQTLVRFLRPALAVRHPDFQAALRHVGPLVIGFAGAVVMDIVDQIFASWVGAGAIAVLSYATMLALVPIEIFGHAVRTAFYTTFSRLWAAGDVAGMAEAHRRGVQVLVFLMVPASTVFIVYAEDLVSLLFERGRFDRDDARAVSWVVMALSVGMLSKATSWFNFAAFHAMVRPWIPVALGLFAVVLNVILTWLLAGPLGVPGIALATSLAVSVTALASSMLLSRALQYRIAAALWGTTWRVIVMSLVMVAVAKGLAFLVAGIWMAPHGTAERVIDLAMLVPGFGAFIAAGWLLGLDEIRVARDFVARRLGGWRGGPPARKAEAE